MYNIRKKLMIQFSDNLVKDGRADGLADQSDFIEHCPTNIKRPKKANSMG